MTVLRSFLDERVDDLKVHLSLAGALDRHLIESGPVPIGETSLTVRHLLTIKSGLVVHLYNLVEAVMSRIIKEVGDAVLATAPDTWSDETLREWLRLHTAHNHEGNEDSRLGVVHRAASMLLSRQPMPLGDTHFKKPSGTWCDVNISAFALRFNVPFRLRGNIARVMKGTPEYGDKSPLVFLAERRNAIAHGRKSFEEGAKDLSLQKIEDLVGITVEYMEHTVNAFQDFLDRKRYIAEAI